MVGIAIFLIVQFLLRIHIARYVLPLYEIKESQSCVRFPPCAGLKLVLRILCLCWLGASESDDVSEGAAEGKDSSEDTGGETDVTESEASSDEEGPDDENEEDDNETSGELDNPNPSLITLDGILGLGGISVEEFKSWKVVDDKAPLDLTACLLRCMTLDLHATALVLCQRGE